MDCVKLLTQYTSNINIRDKDNGTLLTIVCSCLDKTSNLECLYHLLECGADPNLKDGRGLNSLKILNKRRTISFTTKNIAIQYINEFSS